MPLVTPAGPMVMCSPFSGVSNKPLILIVHHEAIIAQDIAMQLRNSGYEPLGPAATDDQAIDRTKYLHQHLSLRDIHLDELMDGIPTAEAVCTEVAIPCIFPSVFSGNSKAQAELTKPLGYLETHLASMS